MRFLVAAFILLYPYSAWTLPGTSCEAGSWRRVSLSAEEWEEFQLDRKCRMHGLYRYYKENRLRREGRFEHNLRQGLFKLYFRDGALAEVRRYQDNLLHGLSEKYYHTPADVMREKLFYQSGLLHGKVVQFDPLGRMTAEVSYKNGLATGKAVEYEYDVKGKLSIKAIEFYKNGRVTSYEEPRIRARVDYPDVDKINENSGLIEKEISIRLMAQFSIKDIVERERLSILLPSDTCIPNKQNVVKEKDKLIYFGRDSAATVCMTIELVGEKQVYALYDGQGFLRETGTLAQNRRDGLIFFYKKGRFVYQRNFKLGVQEAKVFVYPASMAIFEDFQRRVKGDAKNLALLRWDSVGELQYQDGSRQCKQAIEQRAFYLTDLWKDLQSGIGKNQDFAIEICKEGCAFACERVAEFRGSEATVYLQNACNRGLVSACNKLQKKIPDRASPVGEFSKSLPTNQDDCFVNFTADCVSRSGMAKELAVGLGCLMGQTEACLQREETRAKLASRYLAKCKLESDWCVRESLKLRDNNKTELARAMLQQACRNANQSRCSAFARMNPAEEFSILTFGCKRNDIESCLDLGKYLQANQKDREAISVLQSACEVQSARESRSKVDKMTMASAKACKRLAAMFAKLGDEEKAKKYFCEGNLRMGYVNDCSQIKVISKK